MSETTSTPEPATRPVGTTAPQQPAYVEPDRRRSRLTAVAAGVGIAAGVVFIVAVIFFTGFVLGAHSGGDRGHRGGDRESSMMHRHGPPPMGPMWPGPRGGAERPGPGFGPGGPGGAPPEPPQPPTTSAPARP